MDKTLTLDKDLTTWAQLAPFGSFPGMRGDETVEQRCDRAAFEAVIAAFSPEVLVDYEHRAETSDDTSAAAWIQRLEIRGDGSSPEDGLWALLRFTDAGADDVRNRRRRYLSPVWPLDGAGRPTSLKSVALTNTPNFTLRPVLNKQLGGAEQIKKGPLLMKELAALFGLPETATEAEILAAAKAAKDAVAALQARVDEMDKAALKGEAQKVAEENAAKIENKAKFIDLYVANKAFALELLGTLKAAPTVLNKGAAKTPPAFGATVQNKLSQYEAMPDGKEKAAFLRANAQEINDLRNARASAD